LRGVEVLEDALLVTEVVFDVWFIVRTEAITEVRSLGYLDFTLITMMSHASSFDSQAAGVKLLGSDLVKVGT
jgi:hypothetical protein